MPNDTEYEDIEVNALMVAQINYKTDYRELDGTYPYTPTTGSSSISVDNVYRRYEDTMPPRTLLFTDIIKIDASDYPKNIADTLILLSSPMEYEDFLSNIINKTEAKQYKRYKVSSSTNVRERIRIFNLNSLIEKIFQIGNPIYQEGRDRYRPFTITSFDWNKDTGIKSESIPESETHPQITKYTVTVDLDLSEDHPSTLSSKKLQGLSCKQKRAKISQIFGRLTNRKSKTRKKKKRIKHRAPSLVKYGGNKKTGLTRRRRMYKKKECCKKCNKYYKYNRCNKCSRCCKCCKCCQCGKY